MKQIIKDVLEDLAGCQINLESLAARENIARLISTALKSKGCYTEYDDSETGEIKIWPGLDVIENENKSRDISFQPYNESER